MAEMSLQIKKLRLTIPTQVGVWFEVFFSSSHLAINYDQ
jgi:hypothetical protein